MLDEIYDLFIDLDATEAQLDFPVVYTNARAGIAKRSLTDDSDDLRPLFDLIVSALPPPRFDPAALTQFQVNNLDYNDYVGRLAIGRIVSGELRSGGLYTLCRLDGSQVACKVNQMYGWHGLKRIELAQARAGDIVAVAGIEDIHIGETIADRETPRPLPAIRIDEPTIAMIFSVNNSPWAGREGEYVTSRKLRERLLVEQRKNVSLRIEDTASPDAWRVMGRGELQLAILVETMRREGYELQVSKPTIITKEVDGVAHEPMELLLVDVPEEYIGVVSQLLAVRRGKMTKMSHPGSGRVRLEFVIPVARPHRLSLALPHRHARHRHHQRLVRRLRPVAGADPGAHQRRHDRRSRRGGDAVRDLPSAGARRHLHPAGDPRLRRHDRRRVLA